MNWRLETIIQYGAKGGSLSQGSTSWKASLPSFTFFFSCILILFLNLRFVWILIVMNSTWVFGWFDILLYVNLDHEVGPPKGFLVGSSLNLCYENFQRKIDPLFFLLNKKPTHSLTRWLGNWLTKYVFMLQP